MKRLSSSIALLGAFLALSITACDNDTGPEPGVESITVTPAEVTMSVGDVVNLSATVETAGDASGDVTWSSSNSSVATVDGNGVVSGVSEGTATVTATAAADNSKKASATIQVTAPDPAQISITEYRAVSTGETDDDGPVPSPDTVGTACCSDQGSQFDNFVAPGQFAILEMDVEIDAAGRDVQRVEMLMNGDVVDFQEVTSTGGKAAGSNVLNYTLSKNTLDFADGNNPEQGGVVDPDIPNGETSVAARVKFANGETKTVSLGSSVIVKNHQQVIIFDKELPPSMLREDDPDTFVDEEGWRYWGGPDSQASFGVTVVDHQDVGASAMDIENVCGFVGPGFDQGAGHGAQVRVTEDNGFMWTLTSGANGMDTDEGNRGVAGFYCPVPDKIFAADGEAYDFDFVMLSLAFTQELAFPHPKIPDGLSDFGFLLLDWRPPTCDVNISTEFPGEIFVAQSNGLPSPYEDGDYGTGPGPDFPDLILANFDLWFHTGFFFAGVDEGAPFHIGLDTRRFDAFRPAADYPDAVEERWENVSGPGDIPGRMRDVGVDLIETSDLLGNVNVDPACGPTSEFGTDHDAPEFTDVDPDPETMDMLTLRFDVPDGEDELDFMPMFDVFDPELPTEKPASGVNHDDSDRPRLELFITDSGGDSWTPTPNTDDNSEIISDSNGDGVKGDYSIDLKDLVDEGDSYSLTVTAPDMAIHPNVGVLEFPTIKMDGTDPSVTRIDPPQTETSSSDERIIFTIEGEVTDQFGLSSVRVEIRDAMSDGVDECDPETDALVASGDGPGEVLPDNVIEVTPLDSNDRFAQEVTVHNADADGVTDIDQHLCFFIVAEDNASNYEGELFPHSNNAFTHTDIDWQ